MTISQPPPTRTPQPAATVGLEHPSNLRITDTEREAAVQALNRHHAEGRLDITEWDERITNAYQARTRGDLDTLFTDLPHPEPPPRAQFAYPRRRTLTLLVLAVLVLVIAALATITAITGRPVIFAAWWLLPTAWFLSRRWRSYPGTLAHRHGGWTW